MEVGHGCLLLYTFFREVLYTLKLSATVNGHLSFSLVSLIVSSQFINLISLKGIQGGIWIPAVLFLLCHRGKDVYIRVHVYGNTFSLNCHGSRWPKKKNGLDNSCKFICNLPVFRENHDKILNPKALLGIM